MIQNEYSEKLCQHFPHHPCHEVIICLVSSLFSSISLCRCGKYNSVFSFLPFHMKGELLYILFAPWFPPTPL